MENYDYEIPNGIAFHAPAFLDLWHRMKQGNLDARNELVRRSMLYIRAIICNNYPDVLDADDLSQDALVIVLQRLGDWNPRKCTFSLFLFRAIQQGYRTSLKPLKSESLNGNTKYAKTDHELERVDVRDMLRTALATLPASDQYILRAWMETNSYAAVAAKMNRPIPAVRNHVYRVRKKLRKWASSSLF